MLETYSLSLFHFSVMPFQIPSTRLFPMLFHSTFPMLSFKLFQASETYPDIVSHFSSALLFMLSHPSLIFPKSSGIVFVKNPVILVHVSLIPSSKPSMTYSPCSLITVDGDAMPNTDLKASINGLKTFTVIHCQIPSSPHAMPSRSPCIISFPPKCPSPFSSRIYFKK